MDIFQPSNLVEIRVSQLPQPLFGTIRQAGQSGIAINMLGLNRPMYVIYPDTLVSVSILGADAIYCFDTRIVIDQVRSITLQIPKHIRRLMRRATPRKSCDLVVFFQTDGGQQGQGRCLDISIGGMRMVTPQDDIIGSAMSIEMTIYPQENPVRVYGEIVRNQSIVYNNEAVREVGLRFTQISSPDRTRLIRYINS
ncbi:MAG: PilZ domain-containing protein [Armatimonadetes bacterium]|nr:PilZ domain-containing protein [Armatimonadota bacterium]